jgi:diacylglycerol O-acyltransferase / wax synthase
VHNLVISNVPGPPMPIYFAGARITGFYPFGPVFHGAGLNITVLSNDGHVDVGLIASRELAPDLWSLADGLALELDVLVRAAQDHVDPPSRTRRQPAAQA